MGVLTGIEVELSQKDLGLKAGPGELHRYQPVAKPVYLTWLLSASVLLVCMYYALRISMYASTHRRT